MKQRDAWHHRLGLQAANFIFQFFLILIFSGCATSYRPNGITGGFSDTQLAPDLYRVIFRGNGYTDPERAQNFALLRASELVLDGGFTFFAIVNEQQTTSVTSFTTPGRADTTAHMYINPYEGNYDGVINAHTKYTPPETYYFYKPRSGILVKAFQNKPDDLFTFDAAYLQQKLKLKYGIK